MTESTDALANSNIPDFPDAIPEVAEHRRTESGWLGIAWNAWWLTLLCVALAVSLVGWSWWLQGPRITVRFRDGHGLKAENRLLHRGIEVGLIEQVELDDSLQFVDVSIRLSKSARNLAREGSQFWIERPTLDFTGARGLETIIAGRHVAVEPGPDIGERRLFFHGLEQPLPPHPSADALEIILEASDRRGLQAQAPIVYRGLEVGRVRSIGLSSDSRWIQVRVIIDGQYRNLVRANSQFWNRSGLRLELGLTGLQMDAESLAGIAAGGIEFATPDSPGETVSSGRRFELASRAADEWLAWRPRLSHGLDALAGWGELPLQERLTLSWQQRRFGFRTTQAKRGWILPLDDGTAIAPSDLLEAPSRSSPESLRWEIGGVELKRPSSDPLASIAPAGPGGETLVRLPLLGLPPTIARWPVARIGSWSPPKPNLTQGNGSLAEPCPLWIVADVPSHWLPLEWHQISLGGKAPWPLSTGIGLTEEQHGLAIFDSQSGTVVGVVVVHERQAWLFPIEF